jgi:RNA polymerase sigma-70 factor (ECF subfamily)
VEHFFRHEAGRLVAVLTRFFGWRNFDLIEEMVQATLVQALQAWQARGVPDNPSGWIHRVARNKIVDALRRVEVRQRVLHDWAARHSAPKESIDELFDGTQIEDSQLRMIFACCHPFLRREDQLALTLNVLCGFGIAEIARALLLSEETTKKRLQRAKHKLADQQVALEPPDAEDLVQRLDVVHQVLYLLFNEGYSSSRGQAPIRSDLCEEAARLCYILCGHPQCSTPTTLALMALMLFHAARLDARIDDHGRVLLMEDQDRSRWDRRLIRRAQQFLDQSAEGQRVSPFHLEAGIALHHCSAASYAETDWQSILKLYDALLQLHRSPIYLLNRAIVLAQIDGPEAGIAALHELGREEALRRYHLFDAALGELYRQAGDSERARQFFQSARAKTHSPSDQEIIDRRLEKCGL